MAHSHYNNIFISLLESVRKTELSSNLEAEKFRGEVELITVLEKCQGFSSDTSSLGGRQWIRVFQHHRVF